MSLELNKNAKEQIAIEDIVVYKRLSVLRNNTTKAIEYSTSFKGFSVIMGETYVSELIMETSKYLGIEYNFVKLGLHSYKHLKSARYGNEVVAKCIIPKGSSYYYGNFGLSKSYASDTLKYIKIL